MPKVLIISNEVCYMQSLKHRIRIELTPEQEARLTAMVSAGLFTNNAEALRTGLTLLWESYQRDLWLEHHDCIKVTHEAESRKAQ